MRFRNTPVSMIFCLTTVGCGLCGDVAHVAVLCPSFYRAELLYNPTRWDKWVSSMRRSVIGVLQRFSQHRQVARAF